MRLLFLSLLDFNTFDEHNIYTDLLKEFIKNGNEVYCISPSEKRTGVKTHLTANGHILKLRIGNVQKTNIINKGISTLMLERRFICAIKKFFSDKKFDFVLYTTPPITFANVIKYIKKRDGAKTYLMLKDIFPQNAVDLEMMSTRGIKGLIYKYFRKKERKLYALSDRIGCMSKANIDYLLRHNKEISKDMVELCPNCIEVCEEQFSDSELIGIREKYGLPLNKKLFIYGGNLGKPQDIPFIIRCIKACSAIDDVCFVIIGNGTERHLLDNYIKSEEPSNLILFNYLKKDEFESIVACCDVGLIFLDYRFTIPNFPSRILSYMQAGIPVLACTDLSSDVGNVIEEGGFGWKCYSNDVDTFVSIIRSISYNSIREKGINSKEYLKNYYSAAVVYNNFCNVLE